MARSFRHQHFTCPCAGWLYVSRRFAGGEARKDGRFYVNRELIPPPTYSHYLPESPRYDVIRGREDLARQTMRLVYTDISEDIIELKLNSIRETVNLSKAFQERWPVSKRPFIMFKTGAYRRPLIAACGLMAAQQASGFNSLLCKLFLLGSPGGYRAWVRVSGTSGISALTSSRVFLPRLLGYHLPGGRIQ